MSEASKDHIETLLTKAADAQDSAEAMRFSQAALNAANAMCVRNNAREPGAK